MLLHGRCSGPLLLLGSAGCAAGSDRAVHFCCSEQHDDTASFGIDSIQISNKVKLQRGEEARPSWCMVAAILGKPENNLWSPVRDLQLKGQGEGGETGVVGTARGQCPEEDATRQGAMQVPGQQNRQRARHHTPKVLHS
ncbi:hypothetical protein UY3_06725 [Chelonia mydas]|uniref:Secreted protein n=1 Tax=Chelonia mydas TaxID=8469 RepID=M7BFY1_CHEMY|nr:hypothetical protein UY3_06725 [Chelonia mydas]